MDSVEMNTQSSSKDVSGSETEEKNFGKNFRVSVCTFQGARKYMEDRVCMSYGRDVNGALKFTFLGVFDGHGGPEASEYVQKNLLRNICAQPEFDGSDEDFKIAIRNAFISTHRSMWNVIDKWPMTEHGYKSTSGTTASCIFIRRGKVFVAHVGDSGVIAGIQKDNVKTTVRLTTEHKPDEANEKQRIENAGGSVQLKSGIARIVWKRPIVRNVDPVKGPFTELVAFLSVSRSLGDLWSYNRATEQYVVSPEPEITVLTIDESLKCLVLASDGLLNILKPKQIVSVALHCYNSPEEGVCPVNPSIQLLRFALKKEIQLRTDNISIITVMFDCSSDTMPEAIILRRGRSFNLHEVFTAHPAGVLRVTPRDFQLLHAEPVDIGCSWSKIGTHDSTFEGPGHIKPLPRYTRPPRPCNFEAHDVLSNRKQSRSPSKFIVSRQNKHDIVKKELLSNQNLLDCDVNLITNTNASRDSLCQNAALDQLSSISFHSSIKRPRAVLSMRDSDSDNETIGPPQYRVKNEKINLPSTSACKEAITRIDQGVQTCETPADDSIRSDVSGVSVLEQIKTEIDEASSTEEKSDNASNVPEYSSPLLSSQQSSVVQNQNHSFTPSLMLYATRAYSSEYIQNVRSLLFRDQRLQDVRSDLSFNSRKRARSLEIQEDASIEELGQDQLRREEPEKKRSRIWDFLSYLWYGEQSKESKNL